MTPKAMQFLNERNRCHIRCRFICNEKINGPQIHCSVLGVGNLCGVALRRVRLLFLNYIGPYQQVPRHKKTAESEHAEPGCSMTGSESLPVVVSYDCGSAGRSLSSIWVMEAGSTGCCPAVFTSSPLMRRYKQAYRFGESLVPPVG
jgi:hypothetical protein